MVRARRASLLVVVVFCLASGHPAGALPRDPKAVQGSLRHVQGRLDRVGHRAGHAYRRYVWVQKARTHGRAVIGSLRGQTRWVRHHRTNG